MALGGDLEIRQVGFGGGKIALCGVAIVLFEMLFVVDARSRLLLVAGGLLLLLLASVLHLDVNPRIGAVECLLMLRIPWLALLGAFNRDVARWGWLNSAFASAVVAAVVYPSVRKMAREDHFRKWLRYMLASTFVVLFVQTSVKFFGSAAIASLSTRKYLIDLPAGNSNSIAMILSTLGLYLALGTTRRRWRITWLILTVASAIMLSSTGNYLVLSILAVTWGVRKSSSIRPSRAGILILLVLTVGVLVYAAISLQGFMTAFETVFERAINSGRALVAGDLESATTERTLIYGYYWDEVSRNPWLGHGTVPYSGGFESYSAMRPHNIVLEALYQGGILNLLAYGTAIWIAYRQVPRAPESLGVRVAVVYMVVDSLFEPGLFVMNKDFLFWTILASLGGRQPNVV